MTAGADPLRLRPGDLDPEQRALYDSIAGGPRAAGAFRLVEADGSLTGPFGPMLLAPAVGTALSRLGEAIRFGSSLSARQRELAVLAVAVARRSDYEWWAHARAARGAGVEEHELATILRGGLPDLVDGDERAALALVATLLGAPGDDGDARARLGPQRTMELTVLVGYYLTLAALMEQFGVSVPDGEEPPFTR